MTVLKKDLATGLELLAEVLTSSTFPQEEIDRQKQSIIAAIKAREEEPGRYRPAEICRGALSGEPLWPAGGGNGSVGQEPCSKRASAEFYERYYRPNRTIVSVVGDVSHQEIARALNEALPFLA